MNPLRTAGVAALAVTLWAAAVSAARAQAETAGDIHPDEASEALTEACVENLERRGLDRMTAKSECTGRMETMTTLPRASKADIRGLAEMQTRPSMPCDGIRYVFQCVSGLIPIVDIWGCRNGETQADCCGRAYLGLGDFCGRIWAQAQRSGKRWPEGLFVCKCTQRIRRKPFEVPPLEPRDPERLRLPYQ